MGYAPAERAAGTIETRAPSPSPRRSRGRGRRSSLAGVEFSWRIRRARAEVRAVGVEPGPQRGPGAADGARPPRRRAGPLSAQARSPPASASPAPCAPGGSGRPPGRRRLPGLAARPCRRGAGPQLSRLFSRAPGPPSPHSTRTEPSKQPGRGSSEQLPPAGQPGPREGELRAARLRSAPGAGLLGAEGTLLGASRAGASKRTVKTVIKIRNKSF